MRVLNNVWYTTLAQVSALAFHLVYMVIHVVRLSVLWLSVPHLVPFRVFLLSFLLLLEHWPVPLPPCGRHQGNYTLALRQLRSLGPWPKTLLSQLLQSVCPGKCWTNCQQPRGPSCRTGNMCFCLKRPRLGKLFEFTWTEWWLQSHWVPWVPWPKVFWRWQVHRRRLDAFSNPDDQNARSAVLPHFPCEQIHAGVYTWFEKFWARTNMPAFNRPIRIHCKTFSLSARLVFEIKAKCHDFVARYKDHGIFCESESPFCDTSTNITVRQSKSIEDREIGRRFAPLGKVLSTKLQEIFPERDAKDTINVPHLTSVHKSSACWTAGTECENWFSNLHHPDTNICLTLLHLACAIPVFLMMYYDRVMCQASHLAQNRSANVWWPPFRLLAFSPPGESRPPFFTVSLCGGLSISRSTLLDVWPYMTRRLVVENVLKSSLAVCTTRCLATFIPPCGLANVNPDWHRHNSLTNLLIWLAAGSPLSTLSHAGL